MAHSALSSPEEIIEAARNGQMYILVDAEDRENEGDLIMPAQFATPDAVNFMAKHGRGLICLAITADRARGLALRDMAEQNRESMKTAFTASIDATDGITTGISASDRARTIAVAIDPHSEPEDVVSPGHMFPLIAREGGVLVRAGHTEASVDISRLAGLNPSAVICEVMNDDGTMARLPELIAFAQLHGLKVGSIEDLIAFRNRNDRFVERVGSGDFKSIDNQNFRLHVFRNYLDNNEHVALVNGKIDPDEPTLVRVHKIDFASDILAEDSKRAGLIKQSMERLAAEDGPGVLVLLRDPGIKSLLQRLGHSPSEDKDSRILREYGIGAQILVDLGVRKMKLLTNTPPKIVGIDGYDLQLVGTVPFEKDAS